MALIARMLLFTACLVWGVPSVAAENAVPIDISVVREPVTVDTSLSHRRLYAMARCERPGAVGQYLGLAQGTVAISFSYRLAVRETGGDSGKEIAAAVASVDITLRQRDRVVHIASELPPDSCTYRETMAHEQRHVAIDEAVVDLFKSRIRQAAEEAVAALGTVRGPTRDAVTGKVYDTLERVLDSEMAALQSTRRQRQLAFDSVEEYRRLSESCRRELTDFIEEPAPDAGWFDPADCAVPSESGGPS